MSSTTPEQSTKLAVIETGGKQYKVTEGQVLDIELIDATDSVSFDKVLLVHDGNATKIGAPYVASASVNAEILENVKDKKVIVFKFKRKTGYKTKNGHRQKYTRIRVNSISA